MDKSVLVYEGDKGVRLMVKCDGETVWLTQEQMCQQQCAKFAHCKIRQAC